ncbi:hypothetical protein GJV26_17990 [Massilia dura]|uniref:Uncharacterized protein n=1 Tax=Pseudoduganella dura TaxID=321982 RepID=A0A6I3XD68_9BURK|nr:hypothetical protein [Pseudoduganella dura]MUI14337.1 hypothetical protein [Pseudoduganella dura]
MEQVEAGNNKQRQATTKASTRKTSRDNNAAVTRTSSRHAAGGPRATRRNKQQARHDKARHRRQDVHGQPAIPAGSGALSRRAAAPLIFNKNL